MNTKTVAESNGKPLAKTKQRVQRSLAELVRKVHEDENRNIESYFDVGATFAEIRAWEVWKQDGFKSWNDFCRSGPLDYSRQHADRLIAAHKIRGSIAAAPTGATWSQRAVRELLTLTDPKLGDRTNRNEVARISKKVVKRVEAGDSLTAKLVKEVAKKDQYGNNNRARRIWDEVQAQRRKDEVERAQKYGAKTIGELVCDYATSTSVQLDNFKSLTPETWELVSAASYKWAEKSLMEMLEFIRSKNRPKEKFDGNCTYGCNSPTQVKLIAQSEK